MIHLGFGLKVYMAGRIFAVQSMIMMIMSPRFGIRVGTGYR